MLKAAGFEDEDEIRGIISKRWKTKTDYSPPSRGGGGAMGEVAWRRGVDAEAERAQQVDLPHRPPSSHKTPQHKLNSLASPRLSRDTDDSDTSNHRRLDIVLRSKGDVVLTTSSKVPSANAQLPHWWRWHLHDIASQPTPMGANAYAPRRPRGASSWRVKVAAAEEEAAETPRAQRVALSAREHSLPVADTLPQPPRSSRAALSPPRELLLELQASRVVPVASGKSLAAPRHHPRPLLAKVIAAQRPPERHAERHTVLLTSTCGSTDLAGSPRAAAPLDLVAPSDLMAASRAGDDDESMDEDSFGMSRLSAALEAVDKDAEEEEELAALARQEAAEREAAEQAAAEQLVAEQAAEQAVAEQAAAEQVAADQAAAEQAAAEEAAAEKAAAEEAVAVAAAEQAVAEEAAAAAAEQAAAEQAAAALAAVAAATATAESGAAAVGGAPAGNSTSTSVPTPCKGLPPSLAARLAKNTTGPASPALLGVPSPLVPSAVVLPGGTSPMMQRRPSLSSTPVPSQSVSPRAWRRPKLAVLKLENDVSLLLTARPSARTARGLEEALEEAKQRAGPRPSEAFQKLIEAAASKLEETREELRRCAGLRAARLDAFRECDPIRDVVSEIIALMSDEAAGGPCRDDFLNLHFTLTREGFFRREYAGTHLTSAPYAYAPPSYAHYLDGGGAGGGEETTGFSESGGNNDLRVFCEGVQLWRTLLANGGVEEGILTYSVLEAITFELADASLTHAHHGTLKPFGGDAKTSLQAYLDAVISLKKTITHVPAPAAESSTAPSPAVLAAGRRPRRGTVDGAIGLRAAVQAATDAHEKSPRARRASQPTAQPARRPSKEGPDKEPSPGAGLGGGWSVLKKALKAEGAVALAAPAPQPILKHVWPHPEAHRSEMNRRLSLLRMAVSRNGPATKESAAGEFREYCRLIGKGGGGRRGSMRMAMTYYDVDKAWRRMSDKHYIDLTFRYEVAARTPIAKGCNAALSNAHHADEEQTACFVRLLDQDCDGKISESDFCQSMCNANLMDSISTMRDRWQAAAIQLHYMYPGSTRASKETMGK